MYKSEREYEGKYRLLFMSDEFSSHMIRRAEVSDYYYDYSEKSRSLCIYAGDPFPNIFKG